MISSLSKLWTDDKSLAVKIHQFIPWTSWKQHHGRMHAQTHKNIMLPAPPNGGGGIKRKPPSVKNLINSKVTREGSLEEAVQGLKTSLLTTVVRKS